MATVQLVIKKGKTKQPYSWHTKAANGKILADSGEKYVSSSECIGGLCTATVRQVMYLLNEEKKIKSKVLSPARKKVLAALYEIRELLGAPQYNK